MATRRTWIWILVGTAGVCLLGLVAMAVAGVYFVTRHISTEKSSSAEAIRAFDSVRASFPNQRPLYELDSDEQPRVARPTHQLPTSASKPAHLQLLAWDPEDGKLIKVSLPLWVLRLKVKMDVTGKDHKFELERFDFNGEELERIGPALLFDFRD